MAVRAFTDRPDALLTAIRSGIAEGVVHGWRMDQDGDLTLNSPNLANQAWMRPKILPDRLLFNIVGAQNKDMSTNLYAIYHARLVQMLLTHFDTKIKTASATALPTTGDQVPV
ncbi:hypothetical protein JQK88_32565 [Mesorhizobium caraganae]|uniref:hypothetical protein n=1 Tax=Mesorhizobium caraganae TaxID=483206 RepID=UPI00193A4B8A|nr:hypothetical protein [Mesorhizobium caraganae]MBM2715845.1 hypothetical protein [Mesorhizobium caraganae]